MMENLLARAEQIAAAAQASRIDAIAKSAVEELSGVSITTSATGVLLRGRKLLERWLIDPALRFLGSLSK